MSAEVKEIQAEELLSRMEKGEKMQIIDVRELHEWNDGHIAEAKHIPLGTLPDRLEELEKDTPIIMVCRSGVRSWSATEFAQNQGYPAVNMVGGMLAWQGQVVKE